MCDIKNEICIYIPTSYLNEKKVKWGSLVALSKLYLLFYFCGISKKKKKESLYKDLSRATLKSVQIRKNKGYGVLQNGAWVSAETGSSLNSRQRRTERKGS